jgi:hypothetical protein
MLRKRMFDIKHLLCKRMFDIKQFLCIVFFWMLIEVLTFLSVIDK